MKKAEYYVNVKLNEDVTEYPKVNGYVEEIEDSNGNKFKIGYHKNDKNSWVATELTTGLNCNTLIGCRTKAECIENVHNNIDTIAKAFENTLTSDWGEKYVQPFRDYVNSNT